MVSAMSHLAISSRELKARRNQVGSKASPSSAQLLAERANSTKRARVTTLEATSGVVARLKVVAWWPAMRPVHHASLDATNDIALHFANEFWLKSGSWRQDLHTQSHGFDLNGANVGDQKGSMPQHCSIATSIFCLAYNQYFSVATPLGTISTR